MRKVKNWIPVRRRTNPPWRTFAGMTLWAGMTAWVLFSVPSPVYAEGNGTSAGLTLLESGGARPSGLAEAYTASRDDISGFKYNPASLKTLESAQASFFYNKGLGSDSFGQLMLGLPREKSSVGFSLGYFDAGKADLFDGVTQRNVSVEKDLVLSAGLARKMGNVSVGVAGKYLSSELTEMKKTSALAVDLGMQMSLHSRVMFGAALQNYGTSLQYVDDKEPLPRQGRAGFSFLFSEGKIKTNLMVDGVYGLNEKTLHPALGVETTMGPLMLRGGYRKGNVLQEFSLGAGFIISKFIFDYSFGFADQLNSEHRISVTTRFDLNHAESKATVSEIKPQDNPKALAPIPVYQMQTMKEGEARKSRVYEIKEGDTLEKISSWAYGNSKSWRIIYNANTFLIKDPKDLQVGQKIILP